MTCRKCKEEIPEESKYCNLCGAKQTAPRRSRKRANGTGSVYMLKGKRKKPWCAMRCGVYDNDGNPVRKLIGTFATKAEAEQAVVKDAIMPVSEYANITLQGLFDMWKKTHAYTDLTKSTQNNYEKAMCRLSRYHTTLFADLRTAHFQSAIDEAGKSRSTLEKMAALCSILSKYAYSQDIVSKTYHAGIRLPKKDKKDISTFTETEIAKLFKYANDGITDTILILIYTGMRISELLSLTKFNVDLKNMIITGGVKTDAGKDRIIPIHKKIQPLICARYKQADNYLIEYDKEIGNARYGTKSTVRAPRTYANYCELYYAALEQYGIRRLTPHKARHTFFTRLSERCTDRKSMALVGGHTDPNFTEKTYVQPDIERLRRVIECL